MSTSRFNTRVVSWSSNPDNLANSAVHCVKLLLIGGWKASVKRFVRAEYFSGVSWDNCGGIATVYFSLEIPVEKVDTGFGWPVVEGHVVEDNSVVDVWVEGAEHVLVADQERFLELVDCPGCFPRVGISVDEEAFPVGSDIDCPDGVGMSVFCRLGTLSFSADEVDV